MVGESMTLDYITTLTSSGESETLEFKALFHKLMTGEIRVGELNLSEACEN